MGDRTYVYIDGESHFIRSLAAWQNLHGPGALLENLRYIDQPDDALILVESKARIFWTKRMNPAAERTVYFTAAVCDDTTLHDYRVRLRSFGLEPHILKESKALADRRANSMTKQYLIEKPKGVDIALAVRILTDSLSPYNKYDVCHLYTSDVDFIPLIEAVMASGKRVIVHGYANGLGHSSPLLHVPDLFCDLTECLTTQCRLMSPNLPGHMR